MNSATDSIERDTSQMSTRLGFSFLRLNFSSIGTPP